MRVAFLGPEGTFTEEALLTQPDLADADLVPIGDIGSVIAAVAHGDVDLGVVPVENSIEGAVTATLDTLAFEHPTLRVRREIEIPIDHNLLAPPATALSEVVEVRSKAEASAQCRHFLAGHLPGATVVASPSTAEAARSLAGTTGIAAIGTALAAKLYHLEVLAGNIADHPENTTRFWLLGHGVPAPTGHDKTTVVCFQAVDRPGNLLHILQEFSARGINLTKLESRPTKLGLGRYCFFIDAEGHIADELMADCFRNLVAKGTAVSFVGSYPTAGDGGEDDYEVLREEGTVAPLPDGFADHATLGDRLRLWDTTRGAKASGSRFAYLTGDGALLEQALIRLAVDVVIAHGFTVVVPPVLVREQAMYGTGFFPAEKFEYYEVDGGDLYLVGTSEVPLAALHADEILESVPLRYAGLSSCFRREAGSYGKDTSGIFRVHQFTKVEMFAFVPPAESAAEHERILAVEEEIVRTVGLPYRVINVAAGDLGTPAVKKYDVEAWLPSEQRYREITSCSNCTDFQARRLKVRHRPSGGGGSGGGAELVHTLNGTAVTDRWMCFIVEHYQQADGSVAIPDGLQPYMPGQKHKIGGA